jgi:carboxypeptidase Taq
VTTPAFERLRERLAEVSDLRKTLTLLSWDQQVKMPPGGAQARAEVLGTVSRLAQDRFVRPEIGKLLEELRSFEESSAYDSFEASLIRVTRRLYEKASRVSPELVGEMRRAAALALAAWGPAKEASDFERLRPHLETLLELRHRYVECFDPPDETYDLLLDDYEPLMRTAEVREIFAELKEELPPLISELAAVEIDDSSLHGDFDIPTQKRLGLEIVRAFGYTDEEWRVDETAHPFMTTPGAGDIRLTTSTRPDDLASLFAMMHEFGHGVYEWGVDRTFARTPLGVGVSLSVHESQSRTWENLVGRSRAFWRWFYPRLREAFPAQLGSVEEDAFYRAINRVRPSLIRIDSDEVSYNLHIILRFELEQELIENRIAVTELPEAWNARMYEYLGVDVPDDARGVLQDMHWAGGSFGYFPTYALGNVISVQIWERALEDLGDLDERFERGDFGDLREWLREHLYSLGSKFTPQETVERVTGSRIDAQPYLRYLREKLAPQPA